MNDLHDLKSVNIDEATLQTVDTGTGDVLLLVHGFPLDHAMWNAQIAEFSKTHRVIAPDLRGFGASPAAPGTVSMAQFADDLARLLDELGITSKITLCGLSMGGYIAWQFFDRYPERLARLILCDTRAQADSAEARENRYVSADRVLQDGPEFLAESMPEKMLSATTVEENPKLLEEVRATIRQTSNDGIAAALRGMAERPDVSSSLDRITIPTLVIVGEDDIISPVAEMEQIAQGLPDSTLRTIPQAGHLAPLERPDLVNAAIREFLG